MKPCAIVIMIFFSVVSVQASGPGQMADKDLVAELQKGGYVIFLRHPATNADQADTDPLNLDNVQAQRQLSEQGRTHAKDLGQAFRSLKIPVDKVISSKFNRAYETAKLIDIAEVKPTIDVAEGGLVVPPKKMLAAHKCFVDCWQPHPHPARIRLSSATDQTFKTRQAKSSAIWGKEKSPYSSPSATTNSNWWRASPRRRNGPNGPNELAGMQRGKPYLGHATKKAEWPSLSSSLSHSGQRQVERDFEEP
jgi:hypothetical protein